MWSLLCGSMQCLIFFIGTCTSSEYQATLLLRHDLRIRLQTPLFSGSSADMAIILAVVRGEEEATCRGIWGITMMTTDHTHHIVGDTPLQIIKVCIIICYSWISNLWLVCKPFNLIISWLVRFRTSLVQEIIKWVNSLLTSDAELRCEINPLNVNDVYMRLIFTSCERKQRIYMPVLHSGPYHAKKRSQAAPGPPYLVVIVEAMPFHLHHYPSKAGRGSTTLWAIVIWSRALSNTKLFLKWRKQTASSFQLGQKYYL